jgi:hypothetical protein
LVIIQILEAALVVIRTVTGLKRAFNLQLFAGALTAITILFIYSHSAYCASTFIITLSNGNVIEANSYSVEKDKVRLKYPVGEVAFPLKEVLSIKEKDGSLELLQSAGVFAKHKEHKPSPKAVNPNTLALSDRRLPMSGTPVRPKGSTNPDIKDNAAQGANEDAGRQLDMHKTRQPGTTGTVGFGESAQENTELTDAMERYLDTDDENERARLDQTINSLLYEEEQQENDNGAN